MQEPTEAKLRSILRAVFELPPDADVTTISQASHAGWDSLAHTILVGAIESEFGLTVDVGDALEMISYTAIASFLEAQGR